MGQDVAIWAITRGTRDIGPTISPEVGVAGGGKEGVQPPPNHQKPTNNKQLSEDLTRPGPEARRISDIIYFNVAYDDLDFEIENFS